MITEFLKDYFPIILFLAIAVILSMGFIIINYIFSPKKPDPEKLSAYECGFEPFNDSRMEFDVRFYNFKFHIFTKKTRPGKTFCL